MTRTQAFQSLGEHVIYRKVLTRLTKSDLAFCEVFLRDHEKSSKEEFAVAVRNLLIAPSRPTNVLFMDELLMAANTRSTE